MPAGEIALIAPLQRISHPAFERAALDVRIKREDLLDPLLGGNKIYKLLGHLKKWRLLLEGGGRALASFGGAYSNHLLALAAAGRVFSCPTIGVIRGERPMTLSSCLQDAEAMGMRLVFVSRQEYRLRQEADFMAQLQQRESLGEVFWVPEGGAGAPALEGCMALGKAIETLATPDVVCHACGTGTSLAGLALGLSSRVHALGIAVLKGDLAPMKQDVARLVASCSNRSGADCADWSVLSGYACGGYAKCPDYLVEFIADFHALNGIVLDAVYTAKLLRGVIMLAESGFWPAGTKIVVVHSGGLQGNRGFKQLSSFSF